MFGGWLSLVLLIFVPVIISSARRIGRGVRRTTRRGQDKLADIQNILHETITGNRIVKAFSMEAWEMNRFRECGEYAVSREYAVGAGAGDQFAADGFVWARWRLRCCCLLGRGRIQHGAMTIGGVHRVYCGGCQLYDPVRKFAVYYNNFQQALGASSDDLRVHGRAGRCAGKGEADAAQGI